MIQRITDILYAILMSKMHYKIQLASGPLIDSYKNWQEVSCDQMEPNEAKDKKIYSCWLFFTLIVMTTVKPSLPKLAHSSPFRVQLCSHISY